MDTSPFPNKRDRSKKLRLVETTVHGKRRWKLIGYYIDNVRTRKFFLKKAEGERFIEDYNRKVGELGSRAASVPGWIHEQALEANNILAPYGISLLEAAKQTAARLDQQNASITFAELAKRFLASRSKKGRSNRHIGDVRNRTARFTAQFGDHLVSDISTAQIDQWLGNLNAGPVTANNFRNILHNVFEYAVANSWTGSTANGGIRRR
ncbi:MAG TPA: hypothetical protein PLS03_06210 [Terrimicrobiaceae bacterium]|nr:hypothetical protein [Terrimicrobiaceae bacterium]